MNAAAKRASRTREGWGVLLSTHETISARFVLDATGRGSQLGRRAGGELVCLDKLISIAGVLPCCDSDIDRTVEVVPLADGWLFSAVAEDGRRVVAFFTDGDLLRKERRSQCLDRAIESSSEIQRLVGSRTFSEIDVQPAMTHVLADAVHPGLVCIGDAAQACDPLSSSGAGNAIEDAARAATALLHHLRGDPDSLARHEFRRRRAFVDYLRRRLSYYSAEKRWMGTPFWVRRQDATNLASAAAAFGARFR